jgi:hypothetical protein
MGFGGGDKIFNNMLDRVRCAAALRPRKIAPADAPRTLRCTAQNCARSRAFARRTAPAQFCARRRAPR